MKNMVSLNEKYLNDPRSTEELLGLALKAGLEADEAYWHPVRSLQHRLPQIHERVDEWLHSPEPKVREVAATVLGQNSVSPKWNTGQCAEKLLAVLGKETAVEPLCSMLHALGHLHDERCLEPMLRLETHPAAAVRFALVHSLSGFDPVTATHALVRLSRDVDRDVRNWATFELGSLTVADTPQIREALLERLHETDAEIRSEALVGLALRGDPRMIPALLHELESQPGERLQKSIPLGEAAEAVAEVALAKRNPVWLPVLQRLAELGVGEAQKVQPAIEAILNRP